MRQQERQERRRHRALYYSDDEESDMDDDEEFMDEDMLYGGDYHQAQPLRWGGLEQDSIILSSVTPTGVVWGCLGAVWAGGSRGQESQVACAALDKWEPAALVAKRTCFRFVMDLYLPA
jgi:hypothetical protein